MAKLHILQLILLTWCILIHNTSGTDQKFVEKLQNVMQKWVKGYNNNYQQFAMLLMTNSIQSRCSKFLDNFYFMPPISYDKVKTRIQPNVWR